MAIPVFTRDENFSETPRGLYPVTEDQKRMTVEGTVAKTALTLLVVIGAAVLGWFNPVLMLPAVIGGLVIGLVLSFKREPSAPLTIFYGLLQGIALGGISGFLESRFPGVVMQTVLATFSVFTVVLVLFANNKLRTSPFMTKFFLAAMLGYFLFGVINLGLMLTGAIDGMFGVYSATVWGIPIGIPLGILATLLACYSLIMDFEFVRHGADNGIPEKYEWKATFGLVATIVWLYVELLRLISIFRN